MTFTCSLGNGVFTCLKVVHGDKVIVVYHFAAHISSINFYSIITLYVRENENHIHGFCGCKGDFTLAVKFQTILICLSIEGHSIIIPTTISASCSSEEWV